MSFVLIQSLINNKHSTNLLWLFQRKNYLFTKYIQITPTITNTSTLLNQQLPQNTSYSTTTIKGNIQNNSPILIVPSDNSTIINYEELYVDTNEDLRIPLSLSQVQLSHEEICTYLRWNKYIITRIRGKLVRLNGVFKFLSNFNKRKNNCQEGRGEFITLNKLLPRV